MNILNVTSIQKWRGGEAQMYMYFELLQEYKDLNQMILCPEDSVLAGKCKEKMQKHFTYTIEHKVFSLIKPIIKICKANKINVIHVHDSSALTASLLALPFLSNKVQIVLSRKRNNKIKDKFINRFKYSHPRIIKIISVSKAVEKIFDPIIKDKSRLTTIYDAIDVAAFVGLEKQHLIHEEYNLPKETKIIGNVAALTVQKDLHTFIDTAKIILAKTTDKQQIKFVIIGEGPLEDELIAYAKDQGIAEHLLFMGHRKNVNQLLSDFDVFLLTSETEGLPLTIYEALASQVPVVATCAGGIAEVVKNDSTGFVTDLKDANKLAEHVLELLINNELADHIKQNAYKLVKEHHDLKNIKESYYAFYKSLKIK
ncbi:glycosyltransferase family 4 protein [Flavobacterium faecale]|nr:glycosyltransferase family 4 protein [Flavobacterium faecale]